MKRVISIGAAVVVIGFAAVYGGSQWIVKQRSAAETTAVTATPELIAKGKYIAELSDCMACHTVAGGKAFAGGRAMDTPVGAVFSSNITPDKATGIGNYTYAQFKSAVQYGIRADGAPLYPAMPYPSYTVMPDDEIEALYAYFMNAVQPVQQKSMPSTIPPVLNWRWPLAYWELMFSPIRDFAPEAGQNATFNRGKYLVEGPGHCGACHTPRGIGYQEKVLSDDGKYYLSGAVIDGWRAKSLRGGVKGLGHWNTDELNDFFATGRTDKTAAFGAMAEVVEFSTQYWRQDDINAMSVYLKSLAPGAHATLSLPEKADVTTKALAAGDYTSRGAVIYMQNCAVCHRQDGNGIARVFPALNGNTAVTANEPQSVIQVTMEGGKMPATANDAMTFAMPAFAYLSDEDIAAVVNFVRSSWHNQASTVTLKDVSAMRKFLHDKTPNYLPTTTQGEK